MNLDGINKWLTLLANLGVLIGVLFLIAELDQANRIALNESESNINFMSASLSSSIRDSAELLTKLTDSSAELSQTEEIRAESLMGEYMSYWGAAHNAYRNELIADYLFEIHMISMTQTLTSYPKLATILADVYGPRWADISPGELVLVDRIREVLGSLNVSI